MKKTLHNILIYIVLILLAIFLTGPFIWLTFTSLKSIGPTKINMGDVLDWSALQSSLKEHSIPGSVHIWNLLDEKTKSLILKQDPGTTPGFLARRGIVSGLNRVITRKDLYNADALDTVALDKNIVRSAENIEELGTGDLRRLNRRIISGIFVNIIEEPKAGQDIFRLQSARDILPSSPTLENFYEVNRRLPQLPQFFLNTAIIVVLGVFFQLLLSALAAYPLARLEFPGKNLISLLLLSTMMLPAQANMIVNFITIRKMGLFDTLAAVVLPGVISVFGIFLMRQAYLVIPIELEDAARIDGCGEFEIWRRIMLPLTRPALATLAIFSFVAFWNTFMWPLVILKSKELYPLSVGLTYLMNTFDTNFRLVAAGSVLSMLPIIIVFILMQKHFVKGITAGAVK